MRLEKRDDRHRGTTRNVGAGSRDGRGKSTAFRASPDAHRAAREELAADRHDTARYTRSLIEASLDPLVTISPDGMIADVNEATIAATGVARRQLIGSDFSDYFTQPERARAGYREVFAKGAVRDYPLSIRHVSGKTTDVLYNASVYRDESGAVAGVFAAARDITERLRAEGEQRAASRYARSLIEASLDPLVTISPDGMITDVNEATVTATGVPRGELIGSDFSDYFTEPERARAGYREMFAKGAVREYPLSIRHVSGKTTDVLYNATVYRDESGAVAGVFAAARDITERNRAEQELRQYHEQLEQMVETRTTELAAANAKLETANRELEAFSYSVSHDLRTPLRAIDGFSLILLEDYSEKLDDEGKRLLNVVRDGTKKMSQLIDDILTYSRAGRLEMRSARIDMEQAVQALLAEELAPAIAGRKVAVEIKPLPAARGDEAMMRRVWTNLLDNAIKFTAPKPEAKIEIGATAGQGETVYYVRDNGVGFDMQYAGKLFGVFQRLHGTEFVGTGIGLAIVKRIVTRHGGRVWADGKLNDGATFYFALPEARSQS